MAENSYDQGTIIRTFSCVEISTLLFSCADGSGSCRTWSAPLAHYPRDFVDRPEHDPISTHLDGDDETVTLHLAFQDAIAMPVGTRLFINGRDVGPIALFEDDVRPLRFHPFVPDGQGGPAVDVYDVRIPLDLIRNPHDGLLDPAFLTVELSRGPDPIPLPVDQQHLRALVLRGGDQEFMIVNLRPPQPSGALPEPTTAGVMVIGFLAWLRRR